MDDEGVQKRGRGTLRVVVDTNILVGAAYNPGSDSARVVRGCLEGEVEAVVTAALAAEYRHIVPRAVRKGDPRAWVERFIEAAVEVWPRATPAILSFDSSDDMLFHAAIEGGARWIVTNDRPVLQVVSYQDVAIIRPGQAVVMLGCPRTE